MLLRLSGKERTEAAASIELDVPDELFSPEYLSDAQKASSGDVEASDEELDDEPEEEKKISIEQLIKEMTTVEKVLPPKAQECESILIRDRNRVVAAQLVPSITEPEAVVAAPRTVHQDVIGFISRNKDWMKNYQIKVALVANPKTPLPLL